jgi:hypothetical protein
MSTKGSIRDGAYRPRRSQNVASDLAQSDGDLWQEKLAVCEGTTPAGEPRLLIRSFYRNKRTGDRVWDEPPSGAGSVVHATSEMRKKAEMQKEELELTLDMIPPEFESTNTNNTTNATSAKEKGSFLGRFRKKTKSKKEVETSKDLNLQRAIARSLADQNQGLVDQPIVHYDGENDGNLENYYNGEDEEIALAKALSISEAAAHNESCASSDTLTEEEMFQRALEQSQKYSRYNNATGVASIQKSLTDDSSSSFSMTLQPTAVGKRDPNESTIVLPE